MSELKYDDLNCQKLFPLPLVLDDPSSTTKNYIYDNKQGARTAASVRESFPVNLQLLFYVSYLCSTARPKIKSEYKFLESAVL